MQVLPFSTNFSKSGDTAPEDTLETYLYGKKSALSKLVGSGDFQALGRFARAIGKSLDTARESTNTSLPESTKQRRKLKRERVRIVNFVSITLNCTVDLHCGLMGCYCAIYVIIV